METRLAKRKRAEEEGEAVAEGRVTSRSTKKTTSKEPQPKQRTKNPVVKRARKQSSNNPPEPAEAPAPDEVVGQDRLLVAPGPEHPAEQPPGPGVTKRTKETEKAQSSAGVKNQGMAERARERLEDEGAGDIDDQVIKFENTSSHMGNVCCCAMCTFCPLAATWHVQQTSLGLVACKPGLHSQLAE